VRKIPPTILSRCQHFHFKPLDEPTLKKRLHYILKQETVAADEEVVNEIATRAQGFVRDAESLLGLCLSLGLRKLTMASVHGILEKSPLDALCRIAQFTLDYDPVSALITLQELQKQGEHLDQLVHDLIDVFRAAHYYQLTRSDHPQFARRHGTKGMALIRSLVDKNSFSPETLLHALMIGTSRLPLLHYIPPDFFFELIISEIASISSKQLSVPSSRAKRSESSPPPRGGESPASAGSSVRAFARDSSTSVGMTNPQLSSKSITLDDIKHTWSQILTQAQERNQSLPFILKFAQLIKVDSPNIIHIGFPYQFHIERLKERDLTALMENVMSACVGMPVRLAFSLVDSKTLPSNSSPSLVSVLDMFEGKLVDE